MEILCPKTERMSKQEKTENLVQELNSEPRQISRTKMVKSQKSASYKSLNLYHLRLS